MTNDEILKKWAPVEKMLHVDYDKEFNDQNGVLIANSKCLVKANFEAAITALSLLDHLGRSYQIPWTRKQFMWALTDPVGKSKVKQVEQWKHQCWNMIDKDKKEKSA